MFFVLRASLWLGRETHDDVGFEIWCDEITAKAEVVAEFRTGR